MRRITSPMLAAPVASIFSLSTCVRAPAKFFTLFCRPVPSQLPVIWMVSSAGEAWLASCACSASGMARQASATAAAQRLGARPAGARLCGVVVMSDSPERMGSSPGPPARNLFLQMQ